jgi:two-component system, OmpR family, heavy metal sensor histidine kinase CusS
MPNTRSIRFRLTVWYAAVLTVCLGLFASLIWLSLRQRLVSEIDQDLQGQAGRFEKYFRRESGGSATHLRGELDEFCQALPSASYVDVRGPNGFAYRYVAGGAEPPGNSRIRHEQFVSLGETFYLEIGAPMGDVLHTLDLLRLFSWGLLPVVIAIASLGGAWLSGRALKPVRDMTSAARFIGIENLSERLPVPEEGNELRPLTDVLNTTFARLESAVKTLSQFVADASHELRTPLAVIRTTAELALRRSRTPESYRESLQEVVAETERMTRLVEDLLILARSDAGVAQMPRSALDLREVLRDVSAELRNLAEMRQIRLKTTLDEAPATISGNRPALHRLLLVLADNALKYSPAGGEVILAAVRSGGEIAVTVRDFGPGIRPADLPHIFQRFYRADPARAGAGHGLGLSLAESIARAHGASIEVETEEGAGALFRVRFAVRGENPERTGQTAKAGVI